MKKYEYLKNDLCPNLKMTNEMMASMCYIGFVQRESGNLDKAKSTYEELLEIAWHENSVVFERVSY